MRRESTILDKGLIGLVGTLVFVVSLLFTPVIDAAQPSAQPSHVASVKESFRADYAAVTMGTIVNASVWAKTQEQANHLTTVLEESLSHYVTLFTVHDKGPLSDVNRHLGRWMPVDCKIASVVSLAKHIAQQSEGAFDPTIGPLVNTWKIGFGGEHVPDQAAIAAAIKRVDYRRIQVDTKPQACRVKIGAGQNLDLGAIAKGWIGTALIEDLRRAGAQRAMLDLGGNVALLGHADQGREWRIGVQRPDAVRGTPFGVLSVHDVSVITSGAYERNLRENGKTYGHILSAKTGYPVATDMGSVTIVSPNGALADGWTTAFFAWGIKTTLAYLEKNEQIQAVIIDKDLKNVWVSAALLPHFAALDETVHVHAIGTKNTLKTEK